MTDQAKRTVLLVEDDPRLRSVLRGLLDDDPRIQVVGEVGTAGQAIAFALANDVALVIIDHHLDDGASGIEAAAELRGARPSTRILLCTADDAVQSEHADAVISKRNLMTLLGTVQELLALE